MDSYPSERPGASGDILNAAVVYKMTMGLKVRRVLEEDIKDKAKKHREKSDDALESVYAKLMASLKEKKEKAKKGES